MKTIAIGSDHAGFELKSLLIPYLKEIGYNVHDQGTFSSDSVDYPDYAHKVSELVADEVVPLGILICGSANGVCMSANKHKNVRAAIAWLPEIASLAKQHNNANVLCLPARFINTDEGKSILDAFLSASFEGGRHQRRVDKIPC